MRILFLSNFYPPHALGGYEQWCQEVADGLSARGHHVFVLTSRHGANGEPPEPVAAGEPYVRRTLHLQADVHYYRPLDFFAQRRTQERENLDELHGAIEHFNPDVIMVWGMWNLSHMLPYLAEQRMGDRVCYYVSSYWPLDLDLHIQYWTLPTRRIWLRPFKKPFAALALAQLRAEEYPPPLRFDHAVCCSHYVRNTLVEQGALPESANVLLGGTEPDLFLEYAANRRTKKNNVLQMIYFGRLVHDKGVHTAIEALGHLSERQLLQRVKLTILGNGHPDYERQLRELAKEKGVQERVQFARQIPREDIVKVLGRFDLFLFTSIWPEPMARSVMEAMAAGLLVIGTTVGGQGEMLKHGHNGLTFPAENATVLADRIDQALNEPALRSQLAKAGQNMVIEQYTLERMIIEIEQFLMSVAWNPGQRLLALPDFQAR